MDKAEEDEDKDQVAVGEDDNEGKKGVGSRNKIFESLGNINDEGQICNMT